MSQTLLQAARNGTLTKPAEEANHTKVEEEAQTSDSHRLFLTSKWTCAPRDQEPPEVEYLSTITRGSKRKINGKYVDIEEEEHQTHPNGTGGGALVLDHDPTKRRAPPPRRKPGKGRKPGFKKMVTFAEDGRALPPGEVGTAAPPPPAMPLPDPMEMSSLEAPVKIVEITEESVTVEKMLPELPLVKDVPFSGLMSPMTDQSKRGENVEPQDMDVEMGDAANYLPATNEKELEPLPAIPVEHYSPTSTSINNTSVNTKSETVLEPQASGTISPAIVVLEPFQPKLHASESLKARVEAVPSENAEKEAMSEALISPPATTQPAAKELAVKGSGTRNSGPITQSNIEPIFDFLLQPKAISAAYERPSSLPPKPHFVDDKPQALPTKPPSIDDHRPSGLPPKPIFLNESRPHNILPEKPLVAAHPSEHIDEGEISEGEVS